MMNGSKILIFPLITLKSLHAVFRIFEALKKDFIGSARQKKINRTLFDWQHRSFIIQPFIAPQLEELNGQRGWVIWRIYFGWLGGRYQFVGGLWSWRPNVKNHGAKDTICGALV